MAKYDKELMNLLLQYNKEIENHRKMVIQNRYNLNSKTEWMLFTDQVHVLQNGYLNVFEKVGNLSLDVNYRYLQLLSQIINAVNEKLNESETISFASIKKQIRVLVVYNEFAFEIENIENQAVSKKKEEVTLALNHLEQYKLVPIHLQSTYAFDVEQMKKLEAKEQKAKEILFGKDLNASLKR